MSDDVVTGASADIRFGGRSSEVTRDDWLTPPALKRYLYARWDLDFDPCPWPREPGYDGLKVPWTGRAFVNPPYGAETVRWLKKAITEISAGNCEIAVFLINSRTDTRWFHEYVMGGAQELYFIRGRVAFQLPGTQRATPSAFGSMVVVFHQDPGSSGLLVNSMEQPP